MSGTKLLRVLKTLTKEIHFLPSNSLSSSLLINNNSNNNNPIYLTQGTILQYIPTTKQCQLIYLEPTTSTNSDNELLTSFNNLLDLSTLDEDIDTFLQQYTKPLEPSHVTQKKTFLYKQPFTNTIPLLPSSSSSSNSSNNNIINIITDNKKEEENNILTTLQKGTKLYAIKEIEKGEWRVCILSSSWNGNNKKKRKKQSELLEINEPQEERMIDNENNIEEEENFMIGYVPSHQVGKLNRKTLTSKLNKQESNDKKEEEEDKSVHNEVIKDYDSLKKTFTFEMKSIGIFHSVFPTKNGCPRQSGLVNESKGKLEITIPQGAMAIEGLDKFSHVWLLFIFHENSLTSNLKVKIRPPRMDGNGKVGIYSTRTPHRPNGIGLSVGKIEKIEGNFIYLTGADLIDGTPIIDIKPYIARYDSLNETMTPEWIEDDLYVPKIGLDKIIFTEQVENELLSLLPHLEFYKDIKDLKQCIIQVLQNDPRPVYMRKKKDDKLYGFRIDNINVRCKITDENITVVQAELWNE
ncbi:hypothetical protein ABK040_006837 [Willaertia magna]